jgi:hypothetical protein
MHVLCVRACMPHAPHEPWGTCTPVPFVSLKSPLRAQLQLAVPELAVNGDTVVMDALAPPATLDMSMPGSTSRGPAGVSPVRRLSSRGSTRQRSASGLSTDRSGPKRTSRSGRRSVAAGDADVIGGAAAAVASIPLIDVDMARVNAAATVIAAEEEVCGRYLRNAHGRLIPEASLFDNVALTALADEDEEANRCATCSRILLRLQCPYECALCLCVRVWVQAKEACGVGGL